MPSPSEELGIKVQRAKQSIDQIRGTASADGIRIEVDAQGRLQHIAIEQFALANGSHGLSELILTVYQQALDQAVPRATAAMQALMDDPRVARIADMTTESSPFPIASSAPSDLRQAQQHSSGVVGPSDWPDDFEDYPAQKPWWAR